MTLHSGSNTIGYKFDTTDTGNVNLDNIVVTAVAAPPAGQYEAESAALTGGAAIATDHSGYTGTGFVGGLHRRQQGHRRHVVPRDHHVGRDRDRSPCATPTATAST